MYYGRPYYAPPVVYGPPRYGYGYYPPPAVVYAPPPPPRYGGGRVVYRSGCNIF